jgi:sugar phosphate isomerase/epimerase
VRHDSFDLTYCSNIHPASGWPAVFHELQAHALPLKQRLAPASSFGLGLRLSSQESLDLLQDGALSRFQLFLNQEGLYVFTLNGFPYGDFHGKPVKSDVFAPDWRSEERVQYTLRLVKILEMLLPVGKEGGLSTAPLSYKAWMPAEDEKGWEMVVQNLAQIAECLVWVERRTGKEIHLDLEPEPDGLIESAAEAVDFFENCLFPFGGKLLAQRLRVDPKEARRLLQRHIAICLDTSHMAVVGETAEIVDDYLKAGIRIGKVQISAAMAVPIPIDLAQRAALNHALIPFADTIYLHQVSEWEGKEKIRRYADLLDALPKMAASSGCEWRIHFHLPLGEMSKGPIRSTADLTEEVLRRLASDAFSRHLEIETYTWSLLPDNLKGELVDSIEREYRWVLKRLLPPPLFLKDKV